MPFQASGHVLVRIDFSSGSSGITATQPQGRVDSPGGEQTSSASEPAADVQISDEARSLAKLSEEDREKVRELEARDKEVRAHEQAHKSAGGAHTGAISLTYESGPDGKRYAADGEVPIDVSPVKGDPLQTQQKMQQVIRAALAPSAPSAADRRVAAIASATAAEARAEAAQERQQDS